MRAWRNSPLLCRLSTRRQQANFCCARYPRAISHFLRRLTKPVCLRLSFSSWSIAKRLSLVKNFQNVSSQVLSNTTLLAEYLSYHFVHGDFQNVSYTNTSAGGASSSAPSSSTITSASTSSSAASPSGTASLFGRLFGRESIHWLDSSPSPQLDSGVFPNTTLGRTLLDSSDLVMLPGNKSQVLAWTRSGENGNVTILNQMYVFSFNYPLIQPFSFRWQRFIFSSLDPFT